MANKAATASIIAAVGVVAVIGAIAAVTTAKKGKEEGPVSANIKLSTLCSSTLYPTKCEKSLSPVVNETSNPEDVLRAALQVALDEVDAAFARYADVAKGTSDNITKSAVGECKKLLDDAVQDLKDMAGLNPVQAVSQVSDLRTWLSGVMTYIYTCADGFEKPELKEAMDKVLRNSTELSSNALAIITLIGDFVKGEKGKMNKSPAGGSRRLLGRQMFGDAKLDEISRTNDATRRLLGRQMFGDAKMDEISRANDATRRLLGRQMFGDAKLDEISRVDDATRKLLFETLDGITKMSNDANRRLLSDQTFGDASNLTDEFDLVTRRRLMSMSFNDASNSHAVEEDTERRKLSLMFASIANMSRGADLVRRRLMSMSFNDASNMNFTDDGGRRRLMSMSFNDASNMNFTDDGGSRRLMSMSFNDASNMNFTDDGGSRRLMSMSFNDASNMNFTDDGGSRRLMSMSFNDASNMNFTDDGGSRRLMSMSFNDASNMNFTDDGGRRRLMSMSFNDASKANEEDDGAGGRRSLLSTEVEGIASMSAELNRQLLATELPADLAGKRQLLSDSLTTVNNVATVTKGQLEAIANGNTFPGESHRVLTTDVIGTPEDLGQKRHPGSRMLTTDVIGTIDDLGGKRHRVATESFPEWVPRRDRRLLQLGAKAPDAVVAADGSGKFKTITEALNSAPKKSATRYVIYVKAGEYKEYVTVTKDMTNIFMYGDGPTRTRVVGNKSNKDGVATIATRTFSAEGNGFICKSMGFVNSAGPEGHQAVALHVQGDMSVFFNCRFEGYQDTLYVHANRQFFRNCEVLGTIDFIFGNSAAILQNCLMTVRKPMASQANMVTAQGRTDPNMPTGIVLQGCRIVPEQALFPDRLQIATYLGRPWKEYSRTVVMESIIGDLIKPEGWAEWMGDLGLKTLYYAEYANTGPGAGTSKRVTWPGYRVIGQAEATHYTPGVFIDGMTWLQNTGTPNVMGFIK